MAASSQACTPEDKAAKQGVAVWHHSMEECAPEATGKNWAEEEERPLVLGELSGMASISTSSTNNLGAVQGSTKGLLGASRGGVGFCGVLGGWSFALQSRFRVCGLLGGANDAMTQLQRCHTPRSARHRRCP